LNRESALPAFRLESGVFIAQPDPGGMAAVTVDSPALSVITDLTRVKAATVAPDISLRQAEQIMIQQGVRMLFVVSAMPSIEGLITTTDLRGERAMRLVHERGLHYDELTVADAMTGLAMLDAIAFESLGKAVVGNLIATLKRFGRNHLLVVEEAGAPAVRRVRGIVSRSQIERQLGSAIAITPVASTFSEIERALVHSS
jgi:CBS domain-containing protein